jgi:ribonuclease HI
VSKGLRPNFIRRKGEFCTRPTSRHTERTEVQKQQKSSRIKCQDVVEAEARACLVGLQCVHKKNVSSVVVESDNAMVVNAIQRQNQGMSRHWSLFEEINLHVSECCNFSTRKIGR